MRYIPQKCNFEGMNWNNILNEYETIIKIVSIVVIAFILNRFLRVMISAYFKRESARINVDPTAYNFLKNALTFIIVVFASLSVIYSIPAFKQLAVTLFAGAGILAAIIGFASQTAFSNIINGIFIVIFKPFRIGDIVEIGRQQSEYVGRVEDITLRHTVIRNYENKRVVVPNSVISTEIIVNRSLIEEKLIRFMDVYISYESDLDKAIDIIRDEVQKHPNYIDPRTSEEINAGRQPVDVVVYRLSEKGVQLRAYLCGKDSPSSFDLMTDMNYTIKKRFDVEHIEMPYTPVQIMKQNL
jgi:small-conductance mechanosensitive channel